MRATLRSIAPGRTVLMRSASVIALLAALIVGLSSTGVLAQSPDAQGWWTRTQPKPPPGLPIAGTPTVPPPPVVPNVGLYVSGSASAPSAVSALRFTLDEPGVYRLELTPAEGTPPQDGFTIVAVCAVDEPGSWGPQENGAYEDAPPFTCDEGSPLSTVENGQLVWEIPSSQYPGLFEGEMEFVLAPGADAPFQMAFDSPGPETLVLEEPVLPDAPTPTTTVPPVTTTIPPTTTTEPPPLSSSFGNTTPPRPTTTTTVASDEVALAAPDTTAPPPGGALAEPVSAITDDGWTMLRTLAVAALVALAAAMWLGSRPELVARLTAAAGGGTRLGWGIATVRADAPPRGIGRFARPRDNLPPRLG